MRRAQHAELKRQIRTLLHFPLEVALAADPCKLRVVVVCTHHNAVLAALLRQRLRPLQIRLQLLHAVQLPGRHARVAHIPALQLAAVVHHALEVLLQPQRHMPEHRRHPIVHAARVVDGQRRRLHPQLTPRAHEAVHQLLVALEVSGDLRRVVANGLRLLQRLERAQLVDVPVNDHGLDRCLELLHLRHPFSMKIYL